MKRLRWNLHWRMRLGIGRWLELWNPALGQFEQWLNGKLIQAVKPKPANQPQFPNNVELKPIMGVKSSEPIFFRGVEIVWWPTLGGPDLPLAE